MQQLRQTQFGRFFEDLLHLPVLSSYQSVLLSCEEGSEKSSNMKVKHFMSDYKEYFLARHRGVSVTLSSIDADLGRRVLHACICLDWFNGLMNVLSNSRQTISIESAAVIFRVAKISAINLFDRPWLIADNLFAFLTKYKTEGFGVQLEQGLHILMEVASSGRDVTAAEVDKLLVLADLCFCTLMDLWEKREDTEYEKDFFGRYFSLRTNFTPFLPPSRLCEDGLLYSN